MIGRLIGLAFGASLAALSGLMASLTPQVLERAAEFPSGVATAGLLGYFGAVVGGLVIGSITIIAAAWPRRSR